MTDVPTTTPPGGQPQALTAEREADLRADHQCSDVDTWCRAAGCKQDWPCATAQLLAALDEARSEVMRFQDNDSAYDVGYQRADAAAGAAIERLRQERDEAQARLAAAEAERDQAVARAKGLSEEWVGEHPMMPGDTPDYSAWVERLEPIARQRVGWMHDQITELTDRLRAAEAERDAETRRAVFADQMAAGTIADVNEEALRYVQRLEESEARAAKFEALARDQQRLNEAMVASLERGLAELRASEAERDEAERGRAQAWQAEAEQVRWKCQALDQLRVAEAERDRLRDVLINTRRNDGHWYGCWTNDGSSERCSPECALFAETLAATLRQAQGKLGRAPADQA